MAATTKLTPTSVLIGNNMKMPIIGFGTWQSSNDEVEAAIDTALSAGYRHIDTAHIYGNESGIGNVLSKWLGSGKLKREEIFVVTKCHPKYFRPEHIEMSLDESLKNLKLDYVDLFLAHMPVGIKHSESTPPGSFGQIDKSTDLIANWKIMEGLVDNGKTKAIGVSNFNASQIQRIFDVCRIKPSNNQVELYLYLQQPELVKFCKENGVTICAYGPIGSPGFKKMATARSKDMDDSMFHVPMEDPVVVEIGKKYGKSPAQVLLRYLLQYGVAVIPKSVNPERIKHNINVFDFELSKADMSKLEALDKGEDGRQFTGRNGGPLKNLVDHPEYPYPR